MEKKVELFIRNKEESKSVVPKLGIELQKDDGDINIVTQNRDGDDIPLFSIMFDGKLWRYSNIPDDIGLQVDRNGEILEAK
jgi:hypothetical protein